MTGKMQILSFGTRYAEEFAVEGGQAAAQKRVFRERVQTHGVPGKHACL